MNLIESVFNLSEKFMEKPKFVFIEQENVERVAEEIKNKDIPKFQKEKLKTTADDAAFKELVAGAINYCYWYGKHDIRPNGCSSVKMFELVESAFFRSANKDGFIRLLSEDLLLNRFPLVEERLNHLKEVYYNGRKIISSPAFYSENLERSLENLVRWLPGYASDMFLKRASLFFLLLYRKYGWFRDDIHLLHVPADYQVPKALRAEGCLRYSGDLEVKVDNHRLIQKNSLEECEIRSATVLVCKQLVEKTGKNISDIDGYFWLRREEYTSPFHLTITSDY